MMGTHYEADTSHLSRFILSRSASNRVVNILSETPFEEIYSRWKSLSASGRRSGGGGRESVIDDENQDEMVIYSVCLAIKCTSYRIEVVRPDCLFFLTRVFFEALSALYGKKVFYQNAEKILQRHHPKSYEWLKAARRSLRAHRAVRGSISHRRRNAG